MVLVSVLVVSSSPAGASDRAAKSVPASTWSAAVCTSLARWQQELSKAGPTGRVATPKAGRAAIIKYLSRVSTATDTLAKDVRAAGTPTGKDGSAIGAVFTTEVSNVRAAFAKAKADAARLPTRGPTAFADAARAVASEISAAETGALDTVIAQLATGYPTSAVAKSFATTKECRAIT